MSDLPLVPTADTRTALERLTRDPAPLAHRLWSGNPYRALAKTDQRIAAKDVRESAEKLGFRYLGHYDITGLLPFVLRPTRESYVDPLGVVVLDARRGTPHGPFEAQMAKYFLVTFFDDGTSLVTWGKSRPPLRSTDRATERGGTRDVAVDYKSHLDEVAARASKGKKALLVPALETTLALSFYYHSRLRPGTALGMLQTRFILLLLLLRTAFPLAKWLLGWWLRR